MPTVKTHHLTFNDEGLVAGSDVGWSSVLTVPPNPYTSNQTFRNFEGGVKIIEKLYTPPVYILAIVSVRYPHKLQIFHHADGKREKEICSFKYLDSHTVLAVRLNGVKMVVCFKNMLLIYDMLNLQLAHVMLDTTTNLQGVLALSPNQETSLMAFPTLSMQGHLELFDTIQEKKILLIEAHKTPVVALIFNKSGTMLSTASVKGTVIRIFLTLDGSRIIEFQRGFIPVDIYSIAFCPGDKFIGVSSSANTVDIFRCEIEEKSNTENSSERLESGASSLDSDDTHNSDKDQSSWKEWISASLASILPANWSNILNRRKAVGIIRIPYYKGRRSVVAFNGQNNAVSSCSPQQRILLYIGSYYGFLHTFMLNENSEGKVEVISDTSEHFEL